METLNLRETPEVILSTPDSGNKIVEKITEEVKKVEADAVVVEARSVLEKAEARKEQLDQAHTALNDRYGEIAKWLADIAPAYVEELITSAASGGKRPDQKVAGQIVDRENEMRLVLRAITRIAAYLKPEIEIARLRAEGVFQHARAKVFDTLAQERAQRLLESLSTAVSEEGMVHVDTKAGVSGMLTGLANEARREAYGNERTAKELEEKHRENIERMTSKASSPFGAAH